MKKTKLTSLLLVLITLLSALFIPVGAVNISETDTNFGSEEIMPMAANNCCGNNYNLPDDFLNGGRWSDDFDYISNHLYKYHGISKDNASERLHNIKYSYGLPANYNCIFDFTGGVYNQYGEYLGNLITG